MQAKNGLPRCGNPFFACISPNHPGTAFMEMQFYPPDWVPFQNPGGIS
jgi:hypothetical protein